MRLPHLPARVKPGCKIVIVFFFKKTDCGSRLSYRYGWRYQIGPWVRAGYRVVVPDMLGYGGTHKPLAAEEYSTKKLCADLAALLDVVGVSKAVSLRPLAPRGDSIVYPRS
jgi:hypothetical protein